MPGTVTMFETMYDAMNAAGLKPAERAAVYDACMEFSLHGEEPELEGLPKAIFMLIKPALCCSIKRKQNGSKTGAKREQNESKTGAKREQNESKTGTKEKQSVSDTVSSSYSYSYSDTDNACMAESISARHPRNAAPHDTVFAILEAADREVDAGRFDDRGAALAYLMERTEAYREAVGKWPKKERCFIVTAPNWYRKGYYAADPETWQASGKREFDAADPSTWEEEEAGDGLE